MLVYGYLLIIAANATPWFCFLEDLVTNIQVFLFLNHTFLLSAIRFTPISYIRARAETNSVVFEYLFVSAIFE